MLVKPYASQPELVSKILEIPQSARDRIQLAEQEAIVVAVGPEAWKEEAQPRAKPGDRVMISKYAGSIVVGILDKTTYRVINANDVFLAIDVEEVQQSVGLTNESKCATL